VAQPSPAADLASCFQALPTGESTSCLKATLSQESPSQCDKDESIAADEALLDQNRLMSDADLYFAKLQFEERVKFSLRYEFSFETPVKFVRRFFEAAFPSATYTHPSSPVHGWKSFTERFILNTTIFPLSQDFHPVYLAAAYLAVSRRYLLAQSGDDQSEKPALPEMIAGHPWFRFVDPEIDAAQLNFVTNLLDDEYKFLEALLSEEPLPQTQQQLEVEVKPCLAAP